MAKVFVSYSHRQGEWVWDRLVPVLRAGGAEVLIDRERFKVGKAVVGQMDAIQDQAERQVLCLGAEYLASDYCRHEMERAIGRDPAFERGIVLPVRRDDTPLPTAIATANPLHVDLRDDGQDQPWASLLDGCDAGLGMTAPAWLTARDHLVRYLERGRSVNLVVVGADIAWRPLLREVAGLYGPQVVSVDLQDPGTVSRRGLLNRILAGLGTRQQVPDSPGDLAEFDRIISTMALPVRIALSHFDLAAHRRDYGVDLFTTLRWMIMETRKLVLVAQSRTPFTALLPSDHPLSAIEIATVVLE